MISYSPAVVNSIGSSCGSTPAAEYLTVVSSWFKVPVIEWAAPSYVTTKSSASIIASALLIVNLAVVETQ